MYTGTAGGLDAGGVDAALLGGGADTLEGAGGLLLGGALDAGGVDAALLGVGTDTLEGAGGLLLGGALEGTELCGGGLLDAGFSLDVSTGGGAS